MFHTSGQRLEKSCLSQFTANKRMCAAAAFGQLVFYHEEGQEYLGKTGVIELLVQMLSDPDPKLKTLAVCTFSNICFVRCCEYTCWGNQTLLWKSIAILPLLDSIR